MEHQTAPRVGTTNSVVNVKGNLVLASDAADSMLANVRVRSHAKGHILSRASGRRILLGTHHHRLRGRRLRALAPMDLNGDISFL